MVRVFLMTVTAKEFYYREILVSNPDTSAPYTVGVYFIYLLITVTTSCQSSQCLVLLLLEYI